MLKKLDSPHPWLSRLWRYLPYGWLAGGWLTMLWYLMVPGKWLVDSDMAAEMVLADLLNQEGTILSQNWYYSTELRVFHNQWLYRLGLLLFPQNWHAARVLATMILLTVFVASYLFMAHAAGFRRWGVWSAAALLWPFGHWYLFLGLYSGFYIVYMVFSCLCMGLILLLTRGQPCKRQWIAAALLALLSLASGLNGVRQTMMFFMPVGLGALLVLILALIRSRVSTFAQAWAQCREQGMLLLWTAFGTFFNVIGYAVNLKVLSKIYHYQAFDDMSWSKDFSIGELLSVWSDFLGMFGYQQGGALFGLNGIACCCGLLLAAAVVFSVVRLWTRFGHLTIFQQWILISFCVGIVVCGTIFAFVSYYSANYWLPLFPLVFAVLQAEGEAEEIAFLPLRRLLALMFVGCIVVSSIGTIRYEIAYPLRGRKTTQALADFLVENCYTQGFASFWVSQVLTEKSNGQIEMWTLQDPYDDEIRPWLQKVDHTEHDPEGQCFLVVDWAEDLCNKENNPFILYGNGKVVLDDGTYYVMVFDSAQQLHDAIAQMEANQLTGS